MDLGHDKEAQKVFADARKLCDDVGVAMQPLYAVHDSAADLILDHAATLGVDAVLMGVSKRGRCGRPCAAMCCRKSSDICPKAFRC